MSAASPEQELRDRTRRGFLTLAGGAAAGFSLFSWVRSREPVGGMPYPFRNVLRINEGISRRYFSPEHRMREYPNSGAASSPRVNGVIGLKDDPSPADAWKLVVNGPSGQPAQLLTLHDIRALPKVEQVTELNCIEGWTEIVHWGGARFRDFSAKYAEEWQHEPYVSLQTPDREYYVGLDMPSALHPQTLLCYEMNGAPLMAEHGAPLRLVIPVKYGIKNIKRIGKITYSPDRTEDYWAREGYDWYSGL